jgi:hypothetical protein
LVFLITSSSSSMVNESASASLSSLDTLSSSAQQLVANFRNLGSSDPISSK